VDARRLDARLLLTDVPAVELDWGAPRLRPLRMATPAELRACRFPAGSMGPKVEAACRFVEATGGWAAIGALADAAAILSGQAGTTVAPARNEDASPRHPALGAGVVVPTEQDLRPCPRPASAEHDELERLRRRSSVIWEKGTLAVVDENAASFELSRRPRAGSRHSGSSIATATGERSEPAVCIRSSAGFRELTPAGLPAGGRGRGRPACRGQPGQAGGRNGWPVGR
jgi:hypothetical protein